VSRLPVPKSVVLSVYDRSDGRCELDGLKVTGGHLHHRQARGMGSSTADPHAVDNLLLLHPTCHLVRIERHRAEAYAMGWLVRHGFAPADVPVFTYRGWVRLSDSYLPCTEEEAERLRTDGADRA